MPPLPKAFVSFLPEDKIFEPDVFSSCSFIPGAHFEASSVIVSFYGYEIWDMRYGYEIWDLSRRWSSHFWGKVHVFSTFFNNKSKSWCLSFKVLIYVLFFMSYTKKLPFLSILNCFLILGKIQDGDHCWWRHRPPAAPPSIKYTSSCAFLRWLDTVFKGQYLPSLSINYVAINKVLEKLPPQLY